MACKEVYNNIGSGHYSIAIGSTWHRLGLGFSIEWYGPRNLWNVDINTDLLFFWLAIGYSNWKLDDNRCSALREMLDRMED
jgi:hypothetical protein